MPEADLEAPCVLPGRLKKGARRSQQVAAVGDRVRIQLAGEEGGAGVIEELLPRRTKLSRRREDPTRRRASRGSVEQVVVANVDQLLIVASLEAPPFSPGLVDRLLVAAGQGDLEPLVCLNKVDLAPERADAAGAIYRELGYRVIPCSAATGAGLEPLREALADKSTVLAGHSGVGKSSLLNALQPGLALRTGEVSCGTLRGKHTTSGVSLLRLDRGGYVVDTPGVRAFSLWDLDPADLDVHFREFEPFIDRCRYPRCTHTHEPVCAVKDAVEVGRISRARYESYQAIRESLIEGR